MKSISVDFLKNWLIAILLFVVIVLSDTIGQKNKELKEKQRKLDEINAELKINDDDHEILGDEQEEKEDKSPDKNFLERC